MQEAIEQFILEMKQGKHDKLLQEILKARHGFFIKKVKQNDLR